MERFMSPNLTDFTFLQGVRVRRARRPLPGWAPTMAGSDRRRESAATESLAQVLTLGLPPLVQDRDVGADGEVLDAHVEEVLRLIRGGDLGAGRHAHLDGRFEHAALHHS